MDKKAIGNGSEAAGQKGGRRSGGGVAAGEPKTRRFRGAHGDEDVGERKSSRCAAVTRGEGAGRGELLTVSVPGWRGDGWRRHRGTHAPSADRSPVRSRSGRGARRRR